MRRDLVSRPGLIEMELSKSALRVLEARYLRRNGNGQVTEDPREMCERVARAISEAELAYGSASEARRWEARFFQMLSSLDFLPNSPTLMNAGTLLGQLSGCFVLPVDDTMESIFGALRDMALIQRTGGGTGFSFSRLRPAGDRISTTGGKASGPVSFMKVFDCATENIKQGGRRRGANMGVLRIDHPDIEEFIYAKSQPESLANFNLSVGITDDFMAAVDAGGSISLLHPTTGIETGRRAAGPLFRAICDAAWETGDPGLLFLDAIARANPTPELGGIDATNPCGEVPLLPGESCNLGSINLAHFVVCRDGASTLDWDRLGPVVRSAVRFLDDVITANRFPLPAAEATTLANRKIGLGVMGFAEMCILLGISYASTEAVALAERLMEFIAGEARLASIQLARERGVFPNWKSSKYARERLPVRNATLTSIAPTGTISIIAGTSSGIEPLFALAYRRTHLLGNEDLTEVNPLFIRYLEQHEIAVPQMLSELRRTGRLDAHMPGTRALRHLFATALQVSPEQHVRIQAAFQEYVDNAVSKTVNLPETATPEDVAMVYRLAHRTGCKGITVFRYGSRKEQVLELGVEEAPYEREYFAKCDPGACEL
jgi:ribonucleoside-diphosphate reductase alpha chain